MAVKKAKKSVKKKAVKRSIVRKAAPPKDRMLCVECGRELVVDNWGLAESTLYCCGKVMDKKK